MRAVIRSGGKMVWICRVEASNTWKLVDFAFLAETVEKLREIVPNHVTNEGGTSAGIDFSVGGHDECSTMFLVNKGDERLESCTIVDFMYEANNFVLGSLLTAFIHTSSPPCKMTYREGFAGKYVVIMLTETLGPSGMVKQTLLARHLGYTA